MVGGRPLSTGASLRRCREDLPPLRSSRTATLPPGECRRLAPSPRQATTITTRRTHPDAPRYFGARAGDPSKGYYTYRRGNWRILVLDSNWSEVGGCGELSPQGSWLKQTLTNYPAKCTLAYFHHPLFASTGAASIKVRPSGTSSTTTTPT